MSAYLDTLNPEQRHAVEHGVGAAAAAGPLLVIAGAGSGKTNTLAHRVAHLVMNGADPRRILLLTFSRRAAAEMARRVERIAAAVLATRQTGAAAALPWSGTFHGIGARLIREYAGGIGLDPAFTIHDREDSADLINLVRHERGLSATAERFPAKGTCLAIYSRAVNAEMPLEDVLARAYPWCAGWEDELRELFAAYVEAKQRQNVLDYDDLLLYWAQMMAEPALAADIGARFDHVLVDEYQDTNAPAGFDPLRAEAGRARPDGGRRRRAVDLLVPRRDRAQHPGLSQALLAAGRDRHAGAQLPLDAKILDAANAVIGLASERFTKNLRAERAAGQRPLLVTVGDESEQARYVVERVLENREAGIALKSQAVLFRASHHAAMLEIELTRRNIPFVKFGGLKFLDSAHVKDMLACLRLAENPRDRVAGFRVVQLMPGVGPSTAARALDALADGGPRRGARGIQAAAARHGRLARLCGVVPAIVSPRGRLAGRARRGAAVVRAAPGAHPRRCPHARRRSRSIGADRLGLSDARALPHRTHPRSARCGERRGRRAAARRGLFDSVDHPFRQGAGVEFGVRAQRGRWLHPLRSCRRLQRRDRGGAAAPLRRDDARKDQLDVIVPQRFYIHQQARGGDRHVYAGRTRFIPDAIVRQFDRRVWPARRVDATAPRAQTAAPIDVGARMRAMWKRA